MKIIPAAYTNAKVKALCSKAGNKKLKQYFDKLKKISDINMEMLELTGVRTANATPEDDLLDRLNWLAGALETHIQRSYELSDNRVADAVGLKRKAARKRKS